MLTQLIGLLATPIIIALGAAIIEDDLKYRTLYGRIDTAEKDAFDRNLEIQKGITYAKMPQSQFDALSDPKKDAYRYLGEQLLPIIKDIADDPQKYAFSPEITDLFKGAGILDSLDDVRKVFLSGAARVPSDTANFDFIIKTLGVSEPENKVFPYNITAWKTGEGRTGYTGTVNDSGWNPWSEDHDWTAGNKGTRETREQDSLAIDASFLKRYYDNYSGTPQQKATALASAMNNYYLNILGRLREVPGNENLSDQQLLNKINEAGVAGTAGSPLSPSSQGDYYTRVPPGRFNEGSIIGSNRLNQFSAADLTNETNRNNALNYGAALYNALGNYLAPYERPEIKGGDARNASIEAFYSPVEGRAKYSKTNKVSDWVNKVPLVRQGEATQAMGADLAGNVGYLTSLLAGIYRNAYPNWSFRKSKKGNYEKILDQNLSSSSRSASSSSKDPSSSSYYEDPSSSSEEERSSSSSENPSSSSMLSSSSSSSSSFNPKYDLRIPANESNITDYYSNGVPFPDDANYKYAPNLGDEMVKVPVYREVPPGYPPNYPGGTLRYQLNGQWRPDPMGQGWIPDEYRQLISTNLNNPDTLRLTNAGKFNLLQQSGNLNPTNNYQHETSNTLLKFGNDLIDLVGVSRNPAHGYPRVHRGGTLNASAMPSSIRNTSMELDPVTVKSSSSASEQTITGGKKYQGQFKSVNDMPLPENRFDNMSLEELKKLKKQLENER
jgi:hypothetical protein